MLSLRGFQSRICTEQLHENCAMIIPKKIIYFLRCPYCIPSPPTTPHGHIVNSPGGAGENMQIIEGDLIVQGQNFQRAVCFLSPGPTSSSRLRSQRYVSHINPPSTSTSVTRLPGDPDGSLQGGNVRVSRSLSACMLGHGAERAEGSPATLGQRRTETDARWAEGREEAGVLQLDLQGERGEFVLVPPAAWREQSARRLFSPDLLLHLSHEVPIWLV